MIKHPYTYNVISISKNFLNKVKNNQIKDCSDEIKGVFDSDCFTPYDVYDVSENQKEDIKIIEKKDYLCDNSLIKALE